MTTKKLISIVTPCYNKEDNIEELYQRVAAVMAAQPYNYEHICIDNCSNLILPAMAAHLYLFLHAIRRLIQLMYGVLQEAQT